MWNDWGVGTPHAQEEVGSPWKLGSKGQET